MTFTEISQFFADNIEYGDWAFHIGQKGDTIFLQLRFLSEDNYTPGKFDIQHCRKWQLSTWMTPTELVQTAWAATQRAVLHEAAEKFKFKGADIFNIHMNVDRLIDVRTGKDALEHRAEVPVHAH